METKLLTITEAAKYIKRNVKTLQAYERKGVLVPYSRTLTNRRMYSISQLDKFMGVIDGKEIDK